jgi:DNA-binding NarL/FixJ family response regulator
MIKLFLVDDHQLVREGLKQLLEENSDIVIVGEAATGEQVLQKIRKVECDLVLLDISLPDRSGIEILEQLKSIKPEIAVLILSRFPEKQYAIRALRAGAAGYLTKDSASAELISAINKVASGGKYVSQALAERLAFDLSGKEDRLPHEELSNREFEIMRLIALGETTTQIAKELFLAASTVSTYRARLLEKLDLKTNGDIISYAIRHKLVD